MDRSRGRLSRSEDFTRAYRAGRSVANKYLVLYYFERPESATDEVVAGPRVGFSVSKRLGTAVDRNRVKRVLREAIRTHSSFLRGNVDLVLIARAPLMELLESGGLRAVEEKTAEVLGKASLISHREDRRPAS